MNNKTKAARLSIITNSFLIILKTIVGLASGSVSIISEAIHSFMDLLAAIIAYFSVKYSDNPADNQHQYGHGKYENISGVIEAALIFIAAFWIIYEAIQKIINNATTQFLLYGSIVMFISAIINIIVSKKLYKIAKQTGSIALEADALHLKADVYTSIGIALVLLLIKITNYYILDPILAIVVAAFIIKEAFQLIKKAYLPLIDISFSHDDYEKLKSIIKKHNHNFHNLRTRTAGIYKFIDFHLEFNKNVSIEYAHTICDKIEDELKQAFSNADITIHIETLEEPNTPN